MRTLLRASLRSYRDIRTLESNRQGLEKVIEASRGSSRNGRCASLSKELRNSSALLSLEESQIYDVKQFAYEVRDQILEPLLPGHPSLRLADAPSILRQAMANRANVYDGNQMVLYCQNPRHHLLFHIETTRQLSQMDMGLLSLFTENIIVALENIRLNEVIADNQREIIYRIGELVETRPRSPACT
ncbi:DUF3369 domain-containing protein [Aeromonas hydrophila]|uniref:DUF3369 domain-containing protein n=1 Tax=Aeromonas hydrophila TaxID=644 RepID=A0A926FK93_AERHY|nr:DUF3369 domain-containing protein [Aeromonas hydrophila]